MKKTATENEKNNDINKNIIVAKENIWMVCQCFEVILFKIINDMMIRGPISYWRYY